MHIRNSPIALFIQRIYGEQNSRMSQAVKRLSTGSRINSAADDAAGLAISEKTRARIRGLSAAMRNSEDAVSLIYTAEGAMASMHTVLQRMRELAVQSATDTNDTIDRTVLDKEYQQLLQELEDIARQARFNGKQLITGAAENNILIQTGAEAGYIYELVIEGVTPHSLGLSGSNVRTHSRAADALTDLESAILRVSRARASLGASESRLESRLRFNGTEAENLLAAESRIRDADIAVEMAKYTQASLLAQASAAMMAHANALAGNVLYLLVEQISSIQSGTVSEIGDDAAAENKPQEPGKPAASPGENKAEKKTPDSEE